VQLVDLLLRVCDVNIAIVGGPDERQLVESIAAGAGHPESVHGLAGVVRLRDLPTFIARCAMFVGNNSGPKHLTAALGVPTISIHPSVVDAQEWAPLGRTVIAIRPDMSCSPCYLTKPEQCTHGFACLTETLPRPSSGHLQLLMISAPAAPWTRMDAQNLG
jgi:O-antigen biosynthesis protein